MKDWEGWHDRYVFSSKAREFADKIEQPDSRADAR